MSRYSAAILHVVSNVSARAHNNSWSLGGKEPARQQPVKAAAGGAGRAKREPWRADAGPGGLAQAIMAWFGSVGRIEGARCAAGSRSLDFKSFFDRWASSAPRVPAPRAV